MEELTQPNQESKPQTEPEQNITAPTTQLQKDLQQLSHEVLSIRKEINKIIIGQDHMITLLLNGLLCGGHVLIEGVPGIAKTLAAKMLARTLNIKFSRIQFTPDLMPSDVTGTSVFNAKTAEFNFHKGPVHSNIVLIDEVNRSPAKTQAALFEVMEEQQISVDGTTYKMDLPFMVLATQNPIEQEGTYRLPEAQLDRFLFRVKIQYPSAQEEFAILQRFKEDFTLKQTEDVKPVVNGSQIMKYRHLVEQVYIKDELLNYIAQIIAATRNHSDLFLGASPRASLAVMRSSKALAAMSGREFVTPDDIRFVTAPVLNHRIILAPEKEMEGVEIEDVINQVVESIEVPR
ncbi:MAG TPA: magnesium chelatase [Bacteroidetes bacterium]|nr:magnesium chelatase [Bacteroidota bacterium]